MGPAQHGAALAILRDDVTARFEPLIAQVVGGEVRIEGHRGVADDDVPDEIDAPLAPVHRHAIGRERAAGALTVRQDAPAGKPVGVSRRRHRLAVVAADRVDHDRAGPAGGAVGARGLLEEREDREGGGGH